MKTFRSPLVVFAGLLALLTTATAQAVPILQFSPSDSTITSGTAFNVDVLASDMTDLYAYQFSIGFDSTLLNANTITEGGFLSDIGTTFFIPGAIDNLFGSVLFTGNSLLGPIAGANGSGVLATIGFNAVAVHGSRGFRRGPGLQSKLEPRCRPVLTQRALSSPISMSFPKKITDQSDVTPSLDRNGQPCRALSLGQIKCGFSIQMDINELCLTSHTSCTH